MSDELAETLDVIPEHHKRAADGEEIIAAYAYVESVKDTSDYGYAYAWHGWALREAFLAGITYAEQKRRVNYCDGT